MSILVLSHFIFLFPILSFHPFLKSNLPAVGISLLNRESSDKQPNTIDGTFYTTGKRKKPTLSLYEL
jgi:hypothetical protein